MDDGAGPLIGWSLGTGIQRRPLDELCDFPCSWMFKAVGAARDRFIEPLLERVGEVLGRTVQSHELRIKTSSAGQYESATIEVEVLNSEQVYSIYRAIREDSRIRFIL